MNIGRLIGLAVSLLAAAIVIVFAVMWDRSAPEPVAVPMPSDIAAMGPAPLDPSQVQSKPGLDMADPSGMRLERGGWVQIARENGTLSQQYSAERIDPEPGQWLAMEQPRAVFYLENGRVLTLRADEGRTFVPHRAMERGDFRGNVIVKLFVPDSRGEVHLGADRPEMVFESSDLRADLLHGTVVCPEDIRVTTTSLHLDGLGMDLAMADDRKTIEHLHIEQIVGPIVMDRRYATALEQASGAAAEKSGGALGSPVAVVHATPALQDGVPTDTRPPFHRVVLTDSVRIVRYNQGPSSSYVGDRLEAVLSLNNDLVGAGDLVLPGGPDEVWHLHPRDLPMLALAAASEHQQSPHPTQDMIAIWTEGPLEVVRVNEGDPVPASIDQIALTLDGAPLSISDERGFALTSKSMNIEMDRANGETRPRTLVAKGGVMATDSLQSMWSDSLRLRFLPIATKNTGSGVDPLLGGSDIERADAEGGVELQLKQGARAWGDRVQAWPLKQQADLAGPGVQVVRGNARLHEVDRLQVDEATRTILSPGSGRAEVYDRSIIAIDKSGRVGLPTVDGLTRQSHAQWERSMRFQDRGPEGAVLDIEGNVQLRSEPDASEFDRLDASTLSLTFRSAHPVTTAQNAPTGGDLEIDTLHAVGAVRLESQVWPGAKDGSAGEPELFRLQGEDVLWKTATKEAFVPGPGELLMNRPRETSRVAVGMARGASEEGQSKSAKAMTGGLGTTRFAWKGSMQLESRPDGLSQARLESGVEIVHLALDRATKMTISCDRALAVIERRTDNEPEAKTSDIDPLRFGAGGQVRRLFAEGRTFVRTPDYDIDCESFEYDTATRMAVMKARANRTVTITPTTGGTPIHAQAATWDLSTGRMQVQKVSGAVAR
ncbi:MAG: hypothetical protein O2800_00305 [Planctomycetota bacterium]|nr:hypothetical protein [Planctomycetota bacterium]